LLERTEEGVGQMRSLRELLGRAPLLSALGEDALNDMADACELVDVPGGTCLMRAGERLDSLIGVVHGGLRVVRRSDDGFEQTIREFYRGDSLGVLSLVSDRPLPFDLFAIRDSTLARPGARTVARGAHLRRARDVHGVRAAGAFRTWWQSGRASAFTR
jgi:signal-transduction protein with cAMP-binding, CBS, and nucleotidyltransferase domain